MRTVRRLAVLLATLCAPLPAAAQADHAGPAGAPLPLPPVGTLPGPDEPDPLIDALFDRPGDEPAEGDAAPEPGRAPPTPPPRAELERTAFRQAAVALRRALQRARPVAPTMVAELERLAAGLGPAEQAELRELAFRALPRNTDRPTAVKAAMAWLLACGPDDVARCRKGALDALDALGRRAPASPSLRSRVRALREADRCVTRLEARPKRVPACARAASRTYHKVGDALMRARVRLATARIDGRKRPSADRAVAALRSAADVCLEPRCGKLRARALRELAAHHSQRREPEATARAELLALAASLAATPPADPLRVRTREIDRACERLDRSAGAGTCRALEKRLLGRYTFHDHSRRSTGRGLASADVRAVQADYGVLLEECLRIAARSLSPGATDHVDLRWIVTPAGRVEQVRLEPRARDEGPLASCVREQFDAWRYPRSSGEAHELQQRFTMTAPKP